MRSRTMIGLPNNLSVPSSPDEVVSYNILHTTALNVPATSPTPKVTMPPILHPVGSPWWWWSSDLSTSIFYRYVDYKETASQLLESTKSIMLWVKVASCCKASCNLCIFAISTVPIAATEVANIELHVRTRGSRTVHQTVYGERSTVKPKNPNSGLNLLTVQAR